MKQAWINAALECARQKADLYSGCRKILRGRQFVFDLGDDLQMKHAGYTSSKSSMLRRNYFHFESREVARQLWARRLDQDKYGSVGFTTYNHLMKGNKGSGKIEGTSKRASVMGPCIQSIVLTLMKKGEIEVDAFYRTTEMFKKFPADLVFIRDELLGNGFHLGKGASLTCHFANITAHPMYYVTLIPSIKDPIKELETLRKKDKYFFDWCVKWSARYICKEYSRGIDKFSQALRVRKDAYDRIDKDTLRDLQRYFKANHPGYRNNYQEPTDGDDD